MNAPSGAQARRSRGVEPDFSALRAYERVSLGARAVVFGSSDLDRKIGRNTVHSVVAEYSVVTNMPTKRELVNEEVMPHIEQCA